MDDLFLYGFIIILFLGIVYSIISSIVNKIKEPTEEKIKLINLEQEKAKYQQLTKEAEVKIKEAEETIDSFQKKYKEQKEEFEREIQSAKVTVANAAGKQKQYFWEYVSLKKELKEQFSFHPELVAPFFVGIDKQQYYDSIMQSVLQHAFDNHPQVLKLDIYARIHSATSDRIYRTTLNECSCPDHNIRHRPCKHMLYLAYLFGLLQIDQKAQREATEIYNELGVEIAELRESISQEREKHKKLQAVNIEVQNAINEKPNAYPRISGLMADLVALQFKDSEIYLRSKTPPAHKAADEVARMREKAHAIEKRNVEWDEKLETLRNWFPNIDDVFNKDFKVDMWELETREPSAQEIKDYISKHINALKYEKQKNK